MAGFGVAFYFFSGLAYSYFGSFRVTYKDFWHLYELALTHSWLETSLLKYGGHSFFFPTGFWWVALRLFHQQEEPLIIAGIILFCTTSALLLIPIWRDKITSLTAKSLSTLILISASSWMGRYVILTSGGFNCLCSLVTTAAAIGLLMLPQIDSRSPRGLLALLVALSAAFVASFSFGSGGAVWPMLLVLAWCCRLRMQEIAILVFASAVAVVIFFLLPSEDPPWQMQRLPGIGTGIISLCKNVGTPVTYAVAGWRPEQLVFPLPESPLSVWIGAVGVAAAALFVTHALVRRNIRENSLRLVGLGLVTFGLFVSITIVVCLSLARGTPNMIAPRYLFWTALLWAGLFLLIVATAEQTSRLRWSACCLAFGAAIFLLPFHYRAAEHVKDVQIASDNAATSLLNGVRDDEVLDVIAPTNKELPYLVAPLLRGRRLDVFAAGLQDWIGQPAPKLFGGRHHPEQLRGTLWVEALVNQRDGRAVARVIGKASETQKSVPRQLIVLDPQETVCGIARSAGSGKMFNKLLYRHKYPINRFLGYIRNYDPQVDYVARSVEDGAVSDEAIIIQRPRHKNKDVQGGP